MKESWSRTDGVVHIRPPQRGDPARLIAGRDAEFQRFLGPGSDDPDPVACICADGEVVGWVDHDAERAWLPEGEVNLGYHVFASHRGRGVASRAVQLLMHHLAVTGQAATATLLIDPANRRSQALAARTRFVRQSDLDGNPYYKRPVPPLSYRHGDVTIRRCDRRDADMDLAGRDDEHVRWLWAPAEADRWRTMTAEHRCRHAMGWLADVIDAFGTGPRWTFSIDAVDAAAVGGIDVNLASEHAPAGQANISYWVHPDFRGRGIASDAVQLALCFLRDHTGAPRAHLMVEPANTASLAVAASTGAAIETSTVDQHGRTLLRHTLAL
jgi:RimJ/RimL family protein N-acetyltransferase